MQEAARERLSPVAYNYFAAGSFAEASVVGERRRVVALVPAQPDRRRRRRPRARDDRARYGDLDAGDARTVRLQQASRIRTVSSAVARACRDAGTIQVLSSASGIAPAEVAAVPTRPSGSSSTADPTRDHG